MKRALASTAPFGFPETDPVLFLQACHQIGIEAVQFYRNPDDPDRVDVVEALAAADRAGVRFHALHGLFGPDLDPSQYNPEMQRHCLAVYERDGRIALDLGGPMVIVHPSANKNHAESTEKSGKTELHEHGERYSALFEFLQRLADIGERLGVTYLLENLPGYFPCGHDVRNMAKMIREIGSVRLRMCFDTGHAHMTGDVADQLRRCADVVQYLHVHDNDGREDSHLVPGEGTIDWPALAVTIRSADLHAPLMLELFLTHQEMQKQVENGLGERLAALLPIN